MRLNSLGKMMTVRLLNRILITSGLLIASATFTQAQPGITFAVNTTADTVDVNPGDTLCADSGGMCSLRGAIMESNGDIDQNTITVPAGT